jgi:hypothetical protein
MAPSVTTIEDSFRDILKTSSATASVAVRTALGNGVSSIIRADELTKDTIPALPCIALRWQSGGGARAMVQRYYPFWYVYDGLPKFWTRINPLIALIKAAYAELDCIAYCELDYRNESGEITDQGLALRCKYMPFVVSTR